VHQIYSSLGTIVVSFLTGGFYHFNRNRPKTIQTQSKRSKHHADCKMGTSTNGKIRTRGRQRRYQRRAERRPVMPARRRRAKREEQLQRRAWGGGWVDREPWQTHDEDRRRVAAGESGSGGRICRRRPGAREKEGQVGGAGTGASGKDLLLHGRRIDQRVGPGTIDSRQACLARLCLREPKPCQTLSMPYVFGYSNIYLNWIKKIFILIHMYRGGVRYRFF
jgi:hypothetical protein